VSDFEDSYGTATARFYDAAYATLARLGPDVDFYRELARESGGPALELGCGTGRVLLPIAREGIDCTGLDASGEMLAVLRRKAAAEGLAAPRLVQGRMQELDLGGERFALVYSAFRAFQHLYTVEDQLACLTRVRAHLAPGGRLAFDVFNPRVDRIWEEEPPEEQDLRFQHEGEEVVRTVAQRRDRPSQLITLCMRYERRRGGQLVGTEVTRFHMRWFTRFELEHLLFRAGFTDVALYGDFDRSPVGRDSPTLLVVAAADPGGR
jgi:ubiquinone/menaquinone biosynthesis C-methylase UbiE